MVGRHPSAGACDMVGFINHEKTRRSSSVSMKDKILDMMNRPAF